MAQVFQVLFVSFMVIAILCGYDFIYAVGCIDIDRWMDEEARVINYILRQDEIFRVFMRLLITVQQCGISWISFLGAD